MWMEQKDEESGLFVWHRLALPLWWRTRNVAFLCWSVASQGGLPSLIACYPCNLPLEGFFGLLDATQEETEQKNFHVPLFKFVQ